MHGVFALGESIVESNDASPGRGYVGFDPYTGD